jgi:hypothetical protein
MIWLGLFFGVLLIAVWVFVVRPVLVTMPVFSDAFAAEASLWQKWQAVITGWKTIIVSRLTMIGGAAVAVYDYIMPFASGQDWSPVFAKVPAWTVPVGLMTMGAIFAWLRIVTERPPVIVTQKDDSGAPKVIAVLPPLPPLPAIK